MQQTQKILVPVEFSNPCAGAVRYACLLAARLSARVLVLHVMPPPYAGYSLPEAVIATKLGPILADMLADARSRMDDFLLDSPSTAPVDRCVVEGYPALKIIEIAQSQQANLILMPTHGYGPVRQLLLGSVTAKVLHDATCPVWTGAHFALSQPAQPLKLQHILCAVNLGPHSAAVATFAAAVARQAGAKLSLIHIVPVDPATEEFYFSPEWRGQLLDAARHNLAELRAQTDPNIEIHLDMGEVTHSVCEAALNLGADLIVTGRSKRYSLAGHLPTRAYGIIRDAPCPVLSV
jgi:nucleotide-binding universal stress UspA family protein